jgi:transcription initiation factor TFIID TATA-box-binding protein
MRTRKPSSPALMFATGKINVVGVNNEADCILARRRFARILCKLGYSASVKNPKIQNIVASFDFCCDISLEKMQVLHPLFCTYEPELFPGLNYKIIKKGSQSNIVVLVFKSGKVVITGSKNMQDTFEAHLNICSVLAHCTKKL